MLAWMVLSRSCSVILRMQESLQRQVGFQASHGSSCLPSAPTLPSAALLSHGKEVSPMKQVIMFDMEDLESLRLGAAFTIPVPLGVNEVTICGGEAPVRKRRRRRCGREWSRTGDHKPRKPT